MINEALLWLALPRDIEQLELRRRKIVKACELGVIPCRIREVVV
jgi:hypothetical protein